MDSTLKLLPIIALMLMIPVTLYTELRDGKIYNWLTLPAMALGLILGLLDGNLGFQRSLWGLLVGGGVFFIPYLISGLSRGRPVIGGGDVKFAAAVGALMGPIFTLWVIYYAVFVGFALGLAQIGWNLLNRKKSAHKSEPEKSDGEEQDPAKAPAPTPVSSIWLARIPFGTALCVGILITFQKSFLQ